MAIAKDLAGALKKLEYGVYVVTMGKGNEGNAFTASWLSQVSSEPAMIALAVHNKHQSSRLISQNGAFVVNLIAADHPEVAKTYYGPAESGYRKLETASLKPASVTGTAVLEGAIGYVECRVQQAIPSGNHTLFLGEVVSATLEKDGSIVTTSSSGLHYLG